MDQDLPESRESAPPRPAWPSFRAGYRATVGLAVAGGVFGILFGVIALGRGFDAGSTVMMSSAVFAGAAQVAVLDLMYTFWVGARPVSTAQPANARLRVPPVRR